MSAQDPTLAERSRRHRERQAQSQADALAAILAGQSAILQALADLAQALRNGGPPERGSVAQRRGKTGQNGGQPGRALRNGEPARAYPRGDQAIPPTGDDGRWSAPPIDIDDDAHRVALVLTVPGSTGSVVDASELPLTRVVAALAHLQVRGLVRREPGEGAAPDRWVPTARVPALEPLPSVPLVLDLEARSHHVACADYPGHATTHRWVEALEAFVCESCNPQAVDGPRRPSAAATQASGPATVTH